MVSITIFLLKKINLRLRKKKKIVDSLQKLIKIEVHVSTHKWGQERKGREETGHDEPKNQAYLILFYERRIRCRYYYYYFFMYTK